MKYLIFVLLLFIATPVQAEVMPRTLIALYDSREESSPRTTLIHRYAELPATHLGYVVQYHDVNAALPEMTPEVAGVLIWFNPGMEVPDATRYLQWLEGVVTQGKKLVIFEHYGLGDRWRADPLVMDAANRVLSHIGVRDTNRWQSLTYTARLLYADAFFTGYERSYPTPLPPYMDTRAIGSGRPALRVAVREGLEAEGETVSDLLITGPHGGYAAASYALFRTEDEDGNRFEQWYINPVAFLRAVLTADALPKPDITTTNGLRNALVLLDSDGMNALTTIRQPQRQAITALEMITERVLKPFADIPFTVSFTAAELDENCYGLPGSKAAARRAITLPNVEAAVHSASHPLLWRFFAEYTPEKEKPYLGHYPRRPKAERSLYYRLTGWWRWRWQEWQGGEMFVQPSLGKYDTDANEMLNKPGATPRSFACQPFALEDEISGAKKAVAAFSDVAPRLFSWTGDMQPFAEAIGRVAQHRMVNFGGGELRFQPDYPSLAQLPPPGIALSGQYQVYGMNGNERPAGMYGGNAAVAPPAYVQTLARATDIPLRITPLILYAQLRAGEAATALESLISQLRWLQTQPHYALFAADYAQMAEQAQQLRVEYLGQEQYRIERPGVARTVRFDGATLKTVDYTRSQGVLGHRWLGGALYVALIPQEKPITLSLKPLKEIGYYPEELQPYLIFSNAEIKPLQIANNLLTFYCRSWGSATLQWRMPHPGAYTIHSEAGEVLQAMVAQDGILQATIETACRGNGTTLTIKKE